MKSKYLRCLLIAILAAVFVLPAGFIYAQSIGDVLNPFPAGPTACGVSGGGLCQSENVGCGLLDSIESSNNCSKKEVCCVPSECVSNNDGIAECRTSCGGREFLKNTSDCQSLNKVCCVTPIIAQPLSCPGGVCSEDTLILDTPISDIPMSSEEGAAACAQDENSAECQQYQAQDNEPKGLVPCDGFNCTLCSVFELSKNIIDWLVGFIFAISVGFIVWAGMLMMFSGGDSSAVSKARETATTAVIGVAIALSGWLIIGTLLGVLTGSDKVMPWNKITCTAKSIDLGGGAAKLSANCTSTGGICQDTKKIPTCVGGEYKTELCAGAANIQCCVLAAPKVVPKKFVDIKKDEDFMPCSDFGKNLVNGAECLPEVMGEKNSYRNRLSEGSCDGGLKCYEILTTPKP